MLNLDLIIETINNWHLSGSAVDLLDQLDSIYQIDQLDQRSYKINKILIKPTELKHVKLNSLSEFMQKEILQFELGNTIFNEDYTLANCWESNINKLHVKNSNINKGLVLYDSNNINSSEFVIKNLRLASSGLGQLQSQSHSSLRIKGNELFSFEDTIWSFNQELENSEKVQNTPLGQSESCLNNFTRTIQNTKYLFIDGKEQFMIKNKKLISYFPKK